MVEFFSSWRCIFTLTMSAGSLRTNSAWMLKNTLIAVANSNAWNGLHEGKVPGRSDTFSVLSRNTAASYLENAKKKLGVRTIAQAVTYLAAANKRKQN